MPHHLLFCFCPHLNSAAQLQVKRAAPACHCPHRRFENKSNHSHELSSADTEWSWQFKHFTSKYSANNGCTVLFLRGCLQEIKHSLKILHAFLTPRWIILLNLKINTRASLCSNSVRKTNCCFVFLWLKQPRGFCPGGTDCWYVLMKDSLQILSCWQKFVHLLFPSI